MQNKKVEAFKEWYAKSNKKCMTLHEKDNVKKMHSMCDKC